MWRIVWTHGIPCITGKGIMSNIPEVAAHPDPTIGWNTEYQQGFGVLASVEGFNIQN